MLTIVPAQRQMVTDFIRREHRHLKPPVGDVFRLACVDSAGIVHGVVSVGRPVARMSDDGWTLEVSRCATDGARNACSMLYGASRRVAWGLGYRRLLTYTLPDEGGASLRAAGWVEEGETAGGLGWLNHPRHTVVQQPGVKLRWSCTNAAASTVDTIWPDVLPDGQIAMFAAVRAL
jgi:hypothetical protein